ncbi:hypothetical protein SGLAM104S_00386 [Streptomyces glaucescens]
MDFAAQGPEAPADLAWLRGVDAYTMGAYPQAEEEFRTAVRLDPGMADGWLGLHALRVDTTTALLRMFRHRDRFGEQRARHRRTLNSWYWLGWWVQPVLESPRDLLLAHAVGCRSGETERGEAVGVVVPVALGEGGQPRGGVHEGGVDAVHRPVQGEGRGRAAGALVRPRQPVPQLLALRLFAAAACISAGGSRGSAWPYISRRTRAMPPKRP